MWDAATGVNPGIIAPARSSPSTGLVNPHLRGIVPPRCRDRVLFSRARRKPFRRPGIPARVFHRCRAPVVATPDGGKVLTMTCKLSGKVLPYLASRQPSNCPPIYLAAALASQDQQPTNAVGLRGVSIRRALARTGQQMEVGHPPQENGP
jgi:hypothetical protein